jgi:hypothetical protein
MIKIDPDATTADGAELIELYNASGYSQYCISSLIVRRTVSFITKMIRGNAGGWCAESNQCHQPD